MRDSRPDTSFNPRTRVGCDTPVAKAFRRWVLFQSTHPRGVRLWAFVYNKRYTLFQSTHPRGVRPGEQVFELRSQTVSIHAPAWGATSRANTACWCSPVSIHAPAWGATSASARKAASVAVFQSTHPRGVRPCGASRPARRWPGFNPRTRVGCDYSLCPASGWSRKFQSTHPRGVRQQPPDPD